MESPTPEAVQEKIDVKLEQIKQLASYLEFKKTKGGLVEVK